MNGVDHSLSNHLVRNVKGTVVAALLGACYGYYFKTDVKLTAAVSALSLFVHRILSHQIVCKANVEKKSKEYYRLAAISIGVGGVIHIIAMRYFGLIANKGTLLWTGIYLASAAIVYTMKSEEQRARVIQNPAN